MLCVHFGKQFFFFFCGNVFTWANKFFNYNCEVPRKSDSTLCPILGAENALFYSTAVKQTKSCRDNVISKRCSLSPEQRQVIINSVMGFSRTIHMQEMKRWSAPYFYNNI